MHGLPSRVPPARVPRMPHPAWTRHSSRLRATGAAAPILFVHAACNMSQEVRTGGYVVDFTKRQPMSTQLEQLALSWQVQLNSCQFYFVLL